jgi:hypothetical protein
LETLKEKEMIDVEKYIREDYTKETANLIRTRLYKLSYLGYIEQSLGMFNKDNKELLLIRDIIDCSVEDWIKFINRIKATLESDIKNNRSCFTCKLSTVCFAHKELKEILTKLPVNINSNDTPLKREEVFNSLAGCCLMYEENK